MSPHTRDNNKNRPYAYHGYQKRSRNEFGLQMDSTEALSHTMGAYKSVNNCLKQEGLEVVARDGIAQHYTALTIPLTGIYLNPALGLTNAPTR